MASQNAALYADFFKALDRFNDHQTPSRGFEPDIIYSFIHSGLLLASSHEPKAQQANVLLCELTLRRVYFTLIEAIEDPTRSMIFRRVCLDSLHSPLIQLKRFYEQFDGGRQRYSLLQQRLQRLQAPLD
ncbi:hypothetical protein C9I98_24275 [Photobacterium sanctipauli]|uniref:Uncharacterized protein n=1 Tax=Photobacterium sanctipauli TaxID=1342794 RepID=A0A2T3NBR0_9GAMM|nr:hypothetical protein [Photobacterium sanctipauli]PSW11369.1 hypothetical protein C9I98_24275 [Photobacterium sanctipauli]